MDTRDIGSNIKKLYQYPYKNRLYICDFNHDTPLACSVTPQLYNEVKSYQDNQEPSKDLVQFLKRFYSQQHLFPQEHREHVKFRGDLNSSYKLRSIGIQIPISNECPMCCSYCFAKEIDHGKDEDSKFLCDEEFESYVKKIIYFFYKNFPEIQSFDIRYGMTGESISDFERFKKFVRILQESENKYNRTYCRSLLTNGVLLTDKTIEWLNKNIGLIGISIDGDRNTQNALRPLKNGQNSYDLIKKNVAKIFTKQWAGPPGATITITKKNLNLKDNIDAVRALGFRVILSKRARLPKGHPLEINETNVDELIFQYQRLVDHIVDETIRGNFDEAKLILNPHDDLGRVLINYIRQTPSNSCGAGYFNFSVDINGDIYPCTSFTKNEKFKIGNLGGGIDSESIKALDRGSQNRVDKCKKCPYVYHCPPFCLNVSYLHTKSICQPIETECKINMELVKLSAYFWDRVLKERSDSWQVLGKHIAMNMKTV